ncbi:MAG TPA: response regulator transcription factor [Clostridia bacterium]|nr:response regulator transcription factor [Clostridia bacterium]
MLIKVLIVDDIAETRDNVRRLLSFHEEIAVVGEAGNGLEALEQVRKLKPDVVLMDINMPVMDGMTACQKIAALYPSARVVMMTVQGGQEYIRRAYQMGAKGYVVKPFSSEELVNAIKSAYLTCERKLAATLPC